MKLKKMKNIKTLILFLIAGIFLTTNANSENFFAEAKKKYDEKSFEKSKFLFQRNLVYNPKDAKSYLYLAKIFANEENEIVAPAFIMYFWTLSSLGKIGWLISLIYVVCVALMMKEY